MRKSIPLMSTTNNEDYNELYIQVPHWVVQDETITSTDFRVLCALLKFAGSKNVCWPGHKAIGKAVGRSVKQVYNVLRKLEKKQYIKIEKRDGDTNLYTLFYKVIHKVTPRVINRAPIAGEVMQSVADKLYPTNNNHLKGGFNPRNKNNKKGFLPGWKKIGGKWVKE